MRKSTRPMTLTTVLTTLLTSLLFVTAISCSKKTTDDTTTDSATEDSSASGSVASAIGGALAASDSSGTVALREAPAKLWMKLLQPAYAASTCPKVTTSSGQGCTQNGNAVDLTYSACSFGSSAATWTGTLEVSLSGGTAISCGTFPNTGTLTNGQSIQRQFVTSSAPGTATRTSARGTSVTIDHASTNLTNFDSATIATNIGSGYGAQVVFDGSGKRKQIVVKERVYGTLFDHTMNGTLNLSESGTTRTISSGTVTLYHNKLKVIGTSTLSNVVYNNTCCTPISGTITTAYTAGSNVSPNALGSLVVGKSETLTFNSCGNATLADTGGSSTTVALTHCY